MKVFCIGDSLGLPRPGIAYENTWFSMLKKEYSSIEFYPYFIRRLTTNPLRTIFSNYVCHFAPNLVIIQLGICDCAPRIINKDKMFWKIYFKTFESLGASEIGWRIVKKLFRRNNPRRVEVSIERFKNNIESFVKECKCNNIKVLYVLIGRPAMSISERSPFLSNNVVRYNECIEALSQEYPETITIINPLQSGDNDDYLSDGYHTTIKGANKVFEAIKNTTLFDNSL